MFLLLLTLMHLQLAAYPSKVYVWGTLLIIFFDLFYSLYNQSSVDVKDAHEVTKVSCRFLILTLCAAKPKNVVANRCWGAAGKYQGPVPVSNK